MRRSTLLKALMMLGCGPGVALVPARCAAAQPAGAPAAAATVAPSGASSPDALAPSAPHATEATLAELIRRAILDSLPRELAGDDDWGQTKAVTRGLRFRHDDGRLRVEKRKKDVNHGLWSQYHLTVIEPQRHLRVEVSQLCAAGPGRLAFQLYVAARVDGHARVERWREGIKGLNFKAEAASVVAVYLNCEVGFRLAPGKWLTDFVVEPRVVGADLRLVDLDLRRVSKLDGPLAEELGDNLRHTLEKQLRRREPEVVEKLNQAIARNAARLRLSPADVLAAGWSKIRQLWDGAAPPATTDIRL